MNTGVADELETVTPPRTGGAEKNIAIFAAKLVVTGAKFGPARVRHFKSAEVG
jgi:hypothetical protein